MQITHRRWHRFIDVTGNCNLSAIYPAGDAGQHVKPCRPDGRYDGVLLALMPAPFHTAAMAKSTQQRRRRDSGLDRQETHTILCNHPGCTEAGVHRAPKSRQRLNEYYWFCLDHVREYNKSWDFYAGMNQTEIESQVRQDIVGHRPTWPLGRWGASRARAFKVDFFPDDVAQTLNGEKAKAHRQQRSERAKAASSAEDQALAVLDLTGPISFDEVKIRYKSLVKKLHPDANGGDKAAEEQLKLVNQAYSTLKAAAIASA
jgi:hypothetical protein